MRIVLVSYLLLNMLNLHCLEPSLRWSGKKRTGALSYAPVRDGARVQRYVSRETLPAARWADFSRGKRMVLVSQDIRCRSRADFGGVRVLRIPGACRPGWVEAAVFLSTVKA